MRAAVSFRQGATGSARTSAEKVNAPRPAPGQAPGAVARPGGQVLRFPAERLPRAVADFCAASADLIRATFPAPSQHATCCAAASALGCSPDTVERILSGLTKSPDPRLMFACLALYQSRHGRPFPISAGIGVMFVALGDDA